MIKQVKIGSVPYRIEQAHPLTNKDNNTVLWGEVLQGQQKIRIDSEIGPEIQRVVLLHEIIHALLIHTGFSDHEEELPERLGYALDAFLQDNPEFILLYLAKTQDENEAKNGDVSIAYLVGDALTKGGAS